MLHRIRLTKAPTLKKLLDQVDAATYCLGEDALWTGYKDGRIYIWREGHYTELAIEPRAKYLYELDEVEVVR